MLRILFVALQRASPKTKIDAARILSGHRGIARAGGMSPDGTRYLTYSDASRFADLIASM
jgi:hypothetical protein